MDELIQYTVAGFRQWSDFTSRARRKAFWMFHLGVLVTFVVLGFVAILLPRLSSLLIGLLGLVWIVPHVAVSIRRLHDTGRSGWWYLLGFVPLGGFVLLYFYLQDSQPGTNEYGPNPKENAFAYAV